MKQTPLYKYTGNNGELITPIDLGIEHEPMVRIVSDIGFYLTNGEIQSTAIDTTLEDMPNWTEKEYVDEEDIIRTESKDGESYG